MISAICRIMSSAPHMMSCTILICISTFEKQIKCTKSRYQIASEKRRKQNFGPKTFKRSHHIQLVQSCHHEAPKPQESQRINNGPSNNSQGRLGRSPWASKRLLGDQRDSSHRKRAPSLHYTASSNAYIYPPPYHTALRRLPICPLPAGM